MCCVLLEASNTFCIHLVNNNLFSLWKIKFKKKYNNLSLTPFTRSNGCTWWVLSIITFIDFNLDNCFLSVSLVFLLGFGTVPTVWCFYLFFSSLYCLYFKIIKIISNYILLIWHVVFYPLTKYPLNKSHKRDNCYHNFKFRSWLFQLNLF